MQLIHVMAYLDNIYEQKEDSVTIYAEAFRDNNIKDTENVKIYIPMDLYLDCVSVAKGHKDVSVSFSTNDSWRALKQVFKQPQFAFVLDKDFDLTEETEDDLIFLKSF